MCRVLLLLPFALAACASPCHDRYVNKAPAELNKQRILFMACLAADEVALEQAVKQGNATWAAQVRQERAAKLQGLAQLEIQIAGLPPTYEGCAMKCCRDGNPKKCTCSQQCPCYGKHTAKSN